MNISSYVHIDNTIARRDGHDLLENYDGAMPAEDMYRALSYSYMKFFKMDLLCKWAWLGAETLLQKDGTYLYEGIDKTKIGVVLMTAHGCLDVDEKYEQTMEDIPSPALFVYTLPNIMLGEICIRHGFKGEQLCMVTNDLDAEELHFWVNDLMQNRGMDACLCGWVDAYKENKDVCLFWVDKNITGIPFVKENVTNMYQNTVQ